MIRNSSTHLAFLSLLLLCGRPAAQEVSEAASPADVPWVGTTPYVEGRVIVRVQDFTALGGVLAALPADRFFLEKQLLAASDLYLVRVLDGTPVARAAREVAAVPGVRYAVADHLVALRSNEPDDTLFGMQWDKHNTGQSGGTVDADIDAPEAWELGTGSRDYVVAVVDGGFDLTHADLVANYYVNDAEAGGLPLVDDDSNGYVDDVNGWNAYDSNGVIPPDAHGTHVIGIAGAEGDNTIGVAGVNWEVTLMPIAGASSQTSTVLEAYGYACDQKALWISSGGSSGANVVATNSSFGVDFADCNAPAYQPWNDAYDAMGALGILSAVATINANQNVDVVGDVPSGCTSDYTVAVTNTNDDDQRSFAGYGLVSIDLGAPGTNVTSTLPGSAYGPLSGTSMASPQVAGSVALLHSEASSAFQNLRAADRAAAALELKEMLLGTVDPKPALQTRSGGRLNLHAALQTMRSYGESDDHFLAPMSPCAGCIPLSSDDDGRYRTGFLVATSRARAGRELELAVGGFSAAATGSSRGWLWVVPEDAGESGTATPSPAGILHLDPARATARVPLALGNGAGSLRLELPAHAAGARFVLQAAVQDPGGAILLTDGLLVEVERR